MIRSKILSTIAWLFSALALVGSTEPARPTDDLLLSAVDPNPSLKSYTASAQLVVRIHGSTIRKTFYGTEYYDRPNERLVLKNLPENLERYQDLSTTAPTGNELLREYHVTGHVDYGRTSTYTLVPISSGARVRTVTLNVEDATRLLSSVLWSYVNGSTLSVATHYEAVGAFKLPARENIAARFPNYNVDGELSFSNYRIGNH